MASPIFSNGLIAEQINKFDVVYNREFLLQLDSMICTAIRNYFMERKCIIDRNIQHNICDMCLEDNMIEKDLIGVFRIAN